MWHIRNRWVSRSDTPQLTTAVRAEIVSDNQLPMLCFFTLESSPEESYDMMVSDVVDALDKKRLVKYTV